MKGVLASRKNVLLLLKNPENENVELNSVPLGTKNVAKVTIAGNGKVCVIRGI